MSAEILREAAALMRQRAEDATPSPWCIYYGQPWNADKTTLEAFDAASAAGTVDEIAWDEYLDEHGTLFHGDVVREPDAEHIASWHPAVALEVADLLEVITRDVGTSSLAYKAAESFARAYLGRDA